MADGGHLGDREQFWREHVAGWKSNGLSLRLYSERDGLKADTLGYWNFRLKAQAADGLTSSTEPEAGATFLAVHVAEPAVRVPERSARRDSIGSRPASRWRRHASASRRASARPIRLAGPSPTQRSWPSTLKRNSHDRPPGGLIWK